MTAARHSRQLALGVQLDDHAAFENFLPAENTLAVRAVESLADTGQPASVYLFGPPGAGKSHLLQAVCARRGARSAYLPLAELPAEPAVLSGLERLDSICVDDLDAVAGEPAWERALFRLVDGVVAAGGQLAVAASTSPADLAIGLDDLRSRLSWGPVYRLAPLDDEGKLEALRLRAARRGMELPEAAARYLLRRYPRHPARLFALLDSLDDASLAAQRRLTVPFLRQVLESTS